MNVFLVTKFLNNFHSTRYHQIYKNKAVYTAYVAPSRPKSKSITDIRTDGRTDGPTDRRTDGLTDGHNLL